MRSRASCRARYAAVLVAFTFVGLAACAAADQITIADRRNASFTVSKGSQLTIVLQTIGSGEYESPPAVSSQSVQFLGVSQAAFAVPAGPTQEFRFQAVSVGQAVIVFQHSGSNPAVTDTIVVR
jgi:hypothetical protein